MNSNFTEQITAGFLVGGSIYDPVGYPVSNIALNGFPGGTIYSDSNGTYRKILDSGWTGTVIPSGSGKTFTPVNRTYTNLSTSYYYHDYQVTACVTVNLKVFLSGAYVNGTDSMRSTLKTNSILPKIPNSSYSNKSSVFTYKKKSSDTVLTQFWNSVNNIVDWVSIEILNESDFSQVDTTVALLRRDGRVLSLQGDTLINLKLSVVSGNYYIVIRNRNHIAIMSSNSVTLTYSSQLYDFTTGLDKYYGNDAKQLKTGLYGMYSGDANYDGIINDADFTIYQTDSNNGVSGYFKTDFNLDGYVTAKDFNALAPNIRRTVSTKIPLLTSFSSR